MPQTGNFALYVMPDPAYGSPKEWNRLVRILDINTAGSIAAMFAGRVRGWEVTSGTGLSVNISAGEGFMGLWYGRTTAGGYGRAMAGGTLALPANSTGSVYAVKKEVVRDVDPAARDQADLEIQVEFQFVAAGLPAPANSALLAEVTTGASAVSSVVDRRRPLYRWAELSRQETVTGVAPRSSVVAEVSHSPLLSAFIPDLRCLTANAEVMLLGDGMTNSSFRVRITNHDTVNPRNVVFSWTRRGIE